MTAAFAQVNGLRPRATKLREPMFNGRWVGQVLDARGIKHTGWAAIHAALSLLDISHQAELFDAMKKLASGVESAEQIARVFEFLNNCKPVVDTPAPQPVDSLIDTTRHPAAVHLRKDHARVESSSKPAANAPLQVDDEQRTWMREHGLHAYGGKAALKAELDCPKDRRFFLGKYTIGLEVAPSTAPRQYDWDRKLAFQLTRRELPIMAAFLLGFAGPDLAFGCHGADRDKTLELQDQGSHIFLKIRQGKQALALPISPMDHYGLSALFMMAIGLNAPGIDSGVQLMMLKRAGGMSLRSSQSKDLSQ